MPRIYVFDVNETLLDLHALDPLFAETFGDAAINFHGENFMDSHHHYRHSHYPRYLPSLIACCLVLLLTACGTTGTLPTPAGQTPTASIELPGSTSTPAVTTAAVPPTQTNCPAAGTARAATMPALALGNHHDIVYLVKEFHGNTPTSTLKHYDVTTGNKTEILKLAGVSITDPQLSADGQWLLFVTIVGQQNKLQIVRMDGQGLQTLYCSPNNALQNVLWSTNQKLVIFNGSSNNQRGIYLLNLANGTIRLELQPVDNGPPLHLTSIGIPLSWLDNTRVYISFTTEPIGPLDRLGILDISRGPNQQMSDLTAVFQDKPTAPFNYPCWDADSSYDGSALFTAQCSGLSAPNCSGSCALGTREGPSVINTEHATGGPQHTILTNSSLGIATVRAISGSTLLLQIENFSQNHYVDSSQNGLWKLNTDGTGLTRLTTEVKGNVTFLCQFSQNPWSNVSRDGSLYAFETNNTGTYPYAYTLSFGQLSGSSPQSFASISDGTQLAIIGWTTM